MLISLHRLLWSSALLVLFAPLFQAAPSDNLSRTQKLSTAQKILQREKAFCKSFLGTAKPTQSTVYVTQSVTTSAPGPIFTTTNTVTTTDRTATEIVTTPVVVTQTNVETKTSIVPNTVATISPVVATSTVALTTTQVSTQIATATVTSVLSTVTASSTSTVHFVSQVDMTISTTITTSQYLTSTATITATYTIPSPSSMTGWKRRDSSLRKPSGVLAFTDEIIKDACLILLYGSYSKSPTTSTQKTTVTTTGSPTTITASPIIDHATTTVTSTYQPSATVTVQQTQTVDSTTMLTATDPITATVTQVSTLTSTDTSTTTVVKQQTSTVTSVSTITFATTYTNTFTSTATYTATTISTQLYTASKTTITVKPTSTGLVKIAVGDASVNGQYIGLSQLDNYTPLTFASQPQFWEFVGSTGYLDISGYYWFTTTIFPSTLKIGTTTAVGEMNERTGNYLLSCQQTGTLQCKAGPYAVNFYHCPVYAPGRVILLNSDYIQQAYFTDCTLAIAQYVYS